ncbi:hypothetical protein KSP39_PZI009466 [Platanthera zijinensis]|uniref:Uncharacterized protein n=1 Tax=Platanthera zijinensis TaxID=2320716 RepID=A0AAP0BK17_9ASPA
MGLGDDADVPAGESVHPSPLPSDPAAPTPTQPVTGRSGEVRTTPPDLADDIRSIEMLAPSSVSSDVGRSSEELTTPQGMENVVESHLRGFNAWQSLLMSSTFFWDDATGEPRRPDQCPAEPKYVADYSICRPDPFGPPPNATPPGH